MATTSSSFAPRRASALAVAAVVEWLAELLPPIHQRLRARRLPGLAARIVDLLEVDDLDDLAAADPERRAAPEDAARRDRLATLAVLLLRVLDGLQAELAELDAEIAHAVEAHARAPTRADRRRRLLLLIDATAPSPAAARADRRALGRHLDLDALRERLDRQRERRVVEIELALLAVGPAIAAACAGSSDAEHPAASLVRQADPLTRLRRRVDGVHRWTSRLAGVAAVRVCIERLGPTSPGDPTIGAWLLALADDPDEHPWVRAEAIACLRGHDPAMWRSCVVTRLQLEPGPPGVKDFLLRRRIVAQLVVQVENDADRALLEQALARGDPSEHVRIGHAQALVTLAERNPTLAARHLPDLLRAPSAADDGEPTRVRASACMFAVAGLAAAWSTAAPDPGDRFAEVVVAGLCACIRGDPDPLVARIACEQAARLCRHAEGPMLRDALARWTAQLGEALHGCLADDARPAVVHEAAAAAIEAIDEAQRPQRAQWTAALRAAVASVAPGTCATLRVPAELGAATNHRELARILAALTRDDWGLDVDPRGAELLVRRGDHRVVRLWRVLHELRHPAANKRQAFPHTTGRRYAGRLRAHPSRLDEVTATVVPGERVHIDAEAGWGRHLPTPDDLLGLPWLRGDGPGDASERAVVLASSHGLTRVRLRAGFAQRLRARLRLNLDYAELAELRRRSLAASDASERRRYADTLRQRYGVELELEPHPGLVGPRPVPARLRALFPGARAAVPLSLAPTQIDLHYFLTLEGNSQAALGLFALALTGAFLGSGYLRRRRIARARADIPLTIGGWGTRGKSGTERLKAGLFHGLGFRVFAKTTGCEAMFIHAAPLGPQTEIFTFRPYGKATIWEQRELLELAAALDTEVFLWECMALNPEYVDILQRGWMRDDLATITNTYPDHEDIQGPAGIDVAQVIARFIPDQRTVISSELAFNPVLRAVAEQRGATLIEIGDHDGELLASDLLALFPYAEHPRNIALVATLARTLGIDEELAIVTMAEHVYPDLGVLKRYPEVVVGGRRLAFINGCSANERAGFINNWRRTGCDRLAEAGDPARMVMTVVNNRDDRVTRSEVFSRILVRDVSVDAHLLIGTNLAGLRIFIDRALASFLAEQELIDAEALAVGGPAHERARARLTALLARVRAPTRGGWGVIASLLELGFASLGRRFEADSAGARALRDQLEQLQAAPGSTDPTAALAELDRGWLRAVEQLHEATPPAPELAAADEVGPPPSVAELCEHLRDRAARVIVAARLAAALDRALAARDPAAIARVEQQTRDAYAAMFRAQLRVVEDPGSSGDQVLDRCARAVPPGVHVTIMGTQNIKGTGLDFIYRWQAVDAVATGLARLGNRDAAVRREALRQLDAHSDYGFVDAGLLAHGLRRPPDHACDPSEATTRAALAEKAAGIHQDKLAKLRAAAGMGRASGSERLWRAAEGWIDFIDGAARQRQAKQLADDLVAGRISHNRMAVQMRAIYAREKGGWLGKAVRASRARRRAPTDDDDAPD